MKKIILLTAILFVLKITPLHAQVLETEESLPLLLGQVEICGGYEFQASKEGRESALPLSFELGLTRKFTLLVEPVPYTNINPKSGLGATGIGDIEATLFYQLVKERKGMPSISLSAEVKLPTARNSLIGTGKTDITPYFIASKITGKFFTSLNLSYTFLGIPPGVSASNLFNYALGTIYTVSSKNILFAELYGNTSAFGGKDIPEDSLVNKPSIELTGGEVVGSVGYGFFITPELLLSFGISYDNNNAVLFRPGFEWKFGGRGSK